VVVRFAVSALIAATIGGASSGPATAIFAQAARRAWGHVRAQRANRCLWPNRTHRPNWPPARTPCTTGSLRLRCPDLVMSAPSHLHLDRSTIAGHVLLRAASSINNRGTGPLEIRAQRIGSHAMGGLPSDQRPQRSPPSVRRRAKLVFKYVPGERYEHESVGDFSYWKFEHGRRLRSGRLTPSAEPCSSRALAPRSPTVFETSTQAGRRRARRACRRIPAW